MVSKSERTLIGGVSHRNRTLIKSQKHLFIVSLKNGLEIRKKSKNNEILSGQQRFCRD